jgi:transcription elongation GreA/GreB family factor
VGTGSSGFRAVVERYLVGLVPLDDGTPIVSPFSPLGKVLEGAVRDTVLRYETPTGEEHVRVAEIVD